MPISIDIFLEEFSSRGALGGVSGNDKGSGEIWELEDGLRGEGVF